MFASTVQKSVKLTANFTRLKLSRLASACWVVLLSACLMPVSFAATNFSSTEIAEHVLLVKGPTGNTLVAIDNEGLILIEGVSAEYADEYLDFVREETGEKNILALVNTHWHPESAGLNASFAATDTKVIAHANTRQWLGATIRKRGEDILHTPVPKDELPNTTFYENYSIPFRSGSIELGYLIQSHTDGDIYALFPEQNILFTGPLVRGDAWSIVDETTNGFIGGMIDALEVLDALSNENTVIVPAGGELMSKSAYVEQKEMYKGLVQEMVNLLRKSRSAEEVVIANPAVGLMPEWGDPSEFLDQGFRSFYGHLRNARQVGVMP